MINPEKLKEAKEFWELSINSKNKYSVVLNILKDDIKNLKEKGLTYKAISDLLNKNLGIHIKISTISMWYQKHCKSKSSTPTPKETKTQSAKKENSKDESQKQKKQKKILDPFELERRLYDTSNPMMCDDSYRELL